MLVGFSEVLGAAKTYALRDHYEIDTNRELLGLGAANLGAGLSSGMVVNGSLSKTAVNGSAGARTQLSGLTVAALTIVTLLFLTGLFEDLPEATLAAVVIAAVIELVDIPALARLYRIYSAPTGTTFGLAIRPDFVAALAAKTGVLVFDTLPGLFIGIGASLLLLLYRTSNPTSPNSATSPAPAASTRTWHANPSRGSSSSAPKAASSSPMPTTSVTRSSSESPRRTPTPSSSTPKPCPTSTSPPSPCSSNWQESSDAGTSPSSTPATSARSGTCSNERSLPNNDSRSTPPSRPQSMRSPARQADSQ
jgi:MFS superfamily sulfate permease-like transporter